MDLILWRHAKAHDAIENEPDLARALTPGGERAAARMSRWLDRRLPKGVTILCSPAVRAEQTVQALKRPYKICEAMDPQASVQDLLDTVGWPHDKGTVLVVGHHPALGLAAARILGLGDAPLGMRKASVWWLRSREREGAFQTTLMSAMSPQQL